ncbi:hypothetical protein N2152v2_007439 [Parachlorella kessleri]
MSAKCTMPTSAALNTRRFSFPSRLASRSAGIYLRPARRLAVHLRADLSGAAPASSIASSNGASPAKAASVASPAKKEKVDHVKWVLDEIAKGDKVVIAQTAPAVRVAIGEEFDLPAGTATTGQMVATLKKLGFDYVFDALAGADMTIMEEGTELMDRLRSNLHPDEHPAPLPMFTSCCPGWVEMLEKSYPELIPHVSSTKSPHMIVGSAIKNFFSKKIGRQPKDMVVVSIMPCLKKQGEADRIMHQTADGLREVDHVITTRELAALVKERGWDYGNLPAEEFDEFLGIGTGAGAIFGTTGGVMEAALRTVYDLASGEQMPRLVFSEVRGLDGVKEASVTIQPNPSGPLQNSEPVTLNVAVANGLGNAKKLVKAVQEGTANFHFVEVMACPGGCIGGGGQPRSKDKEVLLKRQQGLYSVDERKAIRRSYESPVVKTLYNEWLVKPGSHEAHATLHTYYEPCGPASFDITAPQPQVAAPQCLLPDDSQVCVVYPSSSSEGSSGGSASESEGNGAAKGQRQQPTAAGH